MNIEKTEIWITCDRPIEGDARAVRGSFGNMYRHRPEFHGHVGDKLIYKHPLIQYKVFGGAALVIGLKEGAYLLKAVPGLEYLELYYRRYPVIKQDAVSLTAPFGLTDEMISYTFLMPWVGLNKENYQRYLLLRKKGSDINGFLDKILVGNILSMCKSVGYTANDKISLKSKLEESITAEIKEDVELMTFRGEFETNFLIPDFWGIGGKVSLGYGTVKRKKGGEP
jgi:hypothetical protein